MSAVILEMPAKVQRKAKRRMNRVDVEARHRWLAKHAADWKTDQTDGVEPAEYLEPRVRQLMKLLDEKWGKIPEPTMAEMRQEIADARKRIEKRNAVKAWLSSLGADLDNIKDAEQALFAAFDKLA